MFWQRRTVVYVEKIRQENLIVGTRNWLSVTQSAASLLQQAVLRKQDRYPELYTEIWY